MKFQISNPKSQIPNIKYQISDPKPQTSNSKTGFPPPASCFLLLASCLLVLTACGGMGGGESGPVAQGTPTLMAYFALAAIPTPHAASDEGAPTISSHFAGGQLLNASQAEGAPTLSPRFAGATMKSEPASSAPGNAPTPVSYFTQNTPFPTSTPRPTRTPWPTLPPATPAPLTETVGGGVATSPQFTLATVYTDALAAGWSATESWGVRLNLQDTSYVYDGEFAVAVTPEEDYGSLFFTVAPGSPSVYLYDRTLGVSFWLNAGPGDEPLYLDQLAVTVVGSNAYTYWREEDDSVEIEEGESFFSETRLYYLGLNRALPAETWVEVMVWLDDLPFDPDYTYVTGLYVKSDVGFRQTFYVDEVALVVLEE